MTAGHRAAPARIARLLHLSLLITPIGFFGIALFLGAHPSWTAPAPPGLLRWGGLGIGGVLVAVTATIRNTVPPRQAEESEDAWFAANLPRALTLWALAEAVGMVGATVGLVAGDPLGALPLVGASTILLLHLSPRRLAQA